MEQSKARGSYAKSLARRAEIVQAARESFVEHGFAKASLRDIAERAGITHTGLLHHFRNKDEILAAVLAERDAEEWRHGADLIESADQLGPYFEQLLRHHQQAPELIRLWIELAAAASRADHPAHAYFVERYERSRATFTEGIHEGRTGVSLRPGVSPESASMLLNAVLHGLQLQWLLDPSLDITRPVRDFVRLMLEEE